MDIDARPSSAVPRRLPVWAVAARSYEHVWKNRATLARPLVPVFLVFFAGGIAKALFAPESSGNDQGDGTESDCSLLCRAPRDTDGGRFSYRHPPLDSPRRVQGGVDMLRRGADFRRYVKMLIALIFPGFGPLIIAYAAGEISLSETSGPPVVLVKGIAGLFSDKSSLPIYEKLPGIALTGLAETIYAAVDVVSLSLSYDILVRGNEMRGGAC